MIDATINIFCFYAQKDSSLLEQLKLRLVPLQRQGLITFWSEADISPGAHKDKEIKKHLNSAHIIILLISPNFIASDYCYDVEMKHALEKHSRGEILVIPIITRAVVWEQTPFSSLQVLPRNGKPITRQKDRDEALSEIVREILNIIKNEPQKSNAVKINESSLTSLIPDIEDSLETRPHILIADDQINIIEFIKLGLKYEGFDTSFVTSGEDVLIFTQIYPPDMIILDINFENDGLDGFEVCQRLRGDPRTRETLVLILSAKDDASDRIMGLYTGADDYLTKPFNFEELVAHIRALLRLRLRIKSSSNEIKSDILQFGDLYLDTGSHVAKRAEREIVLTETEYRLLHLFMSHPRQVLDRQTILHRIWGYDFLGETSIIEVYVRYLREKIEDSSIQPRLIQTVRGVGYVLKG